MFELPDDKQSNLINRVFELGRLFFSLTTNDGLFFLDNNFNSLIHLLAEMKQKEVVSIYSCLKRNRPFSFLVNRPVIL